MQDGLLVNRLSDRSAFTKLTTFHHRLLEEQSLAERGVGRGGQSTNEEDAGARVRVLQFHQCKARQAN